MSQQTLKKRKITPTELLLKEQTVRDPQNICEELNKYFVNIGPAGHKTNLTSTWCPVETTL